MWGLGSREDLITLTIYLLVEFVVFQFKSTVKCFFFVVNLALIILKKIKFQVDLIT